MDQCSECLLTDCDKALDSAKACSHKGFLDLFSHRDAATNAYGPEARSQLGATSEASRNMPSSLIDSLANFQITSESKLEMSAGAAALMAKPLFWEGVDGKTKLDLLYLVQIFRGSVIDREAIHAHISNLKYKELSAAELGFVERAQKDIEFAIKGATANKAKKVETAIGFQQKQFPRTSALLHICNYYIQQANMAICTLISDEFDSVAGTTKQKQYEKLPILGGVHMLNRVLLAFFATISSISGQGCASHWAVLQEFLNAMGDDGHPHQFILFVLFECLRKIDGTKGMNIRIFMDKQFSMLYSTTTTRWNSQKPRENGGPSDDSRRKQKALERADEDKDTRPKNTIQPGGQSFGDVTVFDGAGYKGPTKTKKGEIAYCNRWNTGRECNAGIKAGACKGHCAYTHVCSWCKGSTSDHYGAEKDSQGNWACPNHQ